jgi:hypothetical protein
VKISFTAPLFLCIFPKKITLMPLEISSQEKLKALLFFSDPQNQLLALHFLYEEVPGNFWSYLAASQTVFIEEEKVKALSKEIFKKHHQNDLLDYISDMYFGRFDTSEYEDFMLQEQTLFERFPFIKKEDFALRVLYTQTKVVLHKEKDKIIENQNNQSGKS